MDLIDRTGVHHGARGACGDAHILVRLVVQGDIDDDRLEDLAFDALDAIREHAARTALGAAVAIDFAGRVIDLDFDIEVTGGGTASVIHARIADVMEVLERETAIASLGSETVIGPPGLTC